jgi:hypothetical protein
MGMFLHILAMTGRMCLYQNFNMTTSGRRILTVTITHGMMGRHTTAKVDSGDLKNLMALLVPKASVVAVKP